MAEKVERKADAAPGAAPVSSHQVTYNPDGDPVRDITRVEKPGAAGEALARTVKFAYSPTEQLLEVTKQGTTAGKREQYDYDIAGNTTKSVIGDVTTDYRYVHNRLESVTATAGGAPAQTSNYVYDEFGRLTSVNPTGVGEATSYTYDGFDRIVAESRGATTTSTRFDAFDRPTVRTVADGVKESRTRFNYLGTSRQVAAEERMDATHPWQVTKTYAFGPDGKPLVLTSTPLEGEAKTRFYSTNPHGDVEALTNPDGGAVTATYRYTAYGDADKSGTLGEDAESAEPGGPEVDPTRDVLNPYRYSAKRIEPASGNYDMGFRTYDPGLNAFLSRDMYNGALADLRLGMDPWNANRYAFAGGNPITRVELDGHKTLDTSGGGGCPLDNCDDESRAWQAAYREHAPDEATVDEQIELEYDAVDEEARADVRARFVDLHIGDKACLKEDWCQAYAHEDWSNGAWETMPGGSPGGPGMGSRSQKSGASSSSGSGFWSNLRRQLTPAGAEGPRSHLLRNRVRDERGAIGTPGGSGRLTNSQIRDMASRLGFRPTNYKSQRQIVFTNGRVYITQDITSHTGGLWKMARTPEALASKDTRMGTYDYDLNYTAP